MASLGDALLGALLGHSDAEKMFRSVHHPLDLADTEYET